MHAVRAHGARCASSPPRDAVRAHNNFFLYGAPVVPNAYNYINNLSRGRCDESQSITQVHAVRAYGAMCIGSPRGDAVRAHNNFFLYLLYGSARRLVSDRANIRA